jgi:hypothetical protein
VARVESRKVGEYFFPELLTYTELGMVKHKVLGENKKSPLAFYQLHFLVVHTVLQTRL